MAIQPEPGKGSVETSWVLMIDIGFCLKTKCLGDETNNAKIFINVCTSAQINAPREITEEELIDVVKSEDPGRYRVPISLGEPVADLDKRSLSLVDALSSASLVSRWTSVHHLHGDHSSGFLSSNSIQRDIYEFSPHVDLRRSGEQVSSIQTGYRYVPRTISAAATGTFFESLYFTSEQQYNEQKQTDQRLAEPGMEKNTHAHIREQKEKEEDHR